MANRYWVGGTASWDGTAGTKWAETSGGPGGFSVPTSADDVFFDVASGVVTCTVPSLTNINCRSLNFTGFQGTFSGQASVEIRVFGSIVCSAAMTLSKASNCVFVLYGVASTITSNGKVIGNTRVMDSASYTLNDACTVTFLNLLPLCSLDTANYNFTIENDLSASNSGNRTLTLGASNVVIGGSWSIPAGFITVNAGTSTITVTSNNTFIGANQTFYNVVFTSASPVLSTNSTFNNVSFTNTSAGTSTISGLNTFNNLSVNGPSSAGVRQVTFDSRQTINGGLSTTGTAGNRRVWFRGVTEGIAQTLTVNSAASLTDADFRDIYVVGTAAPISGTRIGDWGSCSGITFSTPKTVYWATVAGGTWFGNNWSDTAGGSVSTDNFPLMQDTATVVNTGLNTSATITIDSTFPTIGNFDASARTNAFTLSITPFVGTVIGNFLLGSGASVGYTQQLWFTGTKNQILRSAGKAFALVYISKVSGVLELDGALTCNGYQLTYYSGTFDTKGYNITCTVFDTNYSNFRTLKLNSSTITLTLPSASVWIAGPNLTLDAGTSTINITSTNVTFAGGGYTYYNVNFTAIQAGSRGITGSNTFNNLSLVNNQAGFTSLSLPANQTINGTLSVTGSAINRRFLLASDTAGTQRTLTVGTLVANYCDFRDIKVQGTATGTAISNCGDAGNNAGITFPSPKTVYWNLAGTQNWEATAWAPNSGGTPDVNNFPLAQDTAVFDNAGAAGTVTMGGWFVGNVDMSNRTSSMTLTSGAPTVLGDWKWGTGVTSTSNANAITFAKRGTQTITNNGVTFGCPVTINGLANITTVQLADALTTTGDVGLNTGTFDAVSYNVTCNGLQSNVTTTRTLKMGSGLWTVTSSSGIWSVNSGGMTLIKGSADILASSNTTFNRSFAGGSQAYNKLIIGGTAAGGTMGIGDFNSFTELASTKTLAHTINFTQAQTFAKWTVTGSPGNIVTIGGSAVNHVLAGPATSGIDYLAMGTVTFSTGSLGEFYAGSNSTGSATAPVYFTAPPAPRTLYWVGGTGNWSSTAKWSLSSNGPSGEAVPTSLDNVVFDSGSNATAYTATIDVTSRCNSLTIAGPASGNLTLAGAAALIAHNNVTFPATGLTRTYTGSITLSGSTTGKTFTTNGVQLDSNITIYGHGSEWTLGSALSINPQTIFRNMTVSAGTFKTGGYNIAYELGSTTGLFINGADANVFLSNSSISFSYINQSAGTINAETSTFTTRGSVGGSYANRFTGGVYNCGTSTVALNGGIGINTGILVSQPTSFYNVSTTATPASLTFNGSMTFNQLTINAIGDKALLPVSFDSNQTIGALTIAGSAAAFRYVVSSSVVGTPRTLTCTSSSLTNVDFRDIIIAGAAAPASGTRIGDLKGNSGIVFDTPKTVYWNLAGTQNWNATGWALTSNGTPNANNFPLPQDTAVFDNAGSVTGTITLGAWYVGTIDMSQRTTAMTLSTTTPTIVGNWINGSGTTLAGTSAITFAGRATQQITSAGKTWTQLITIDSPSGSVVLQDAFTASQSSASVLTVTNGAFNANGYNITLSGAASGVSSSNSNTRTIAIGAGTWTIAGTGGWAASTSTNLTVTGTGTITLSSASAKTFAGGGISYSDNILNQGGAGTLTVTGNNTFKTITNTYSATGATTISFGTTTTRITSPWLANGQSGRVLTITGTSASSPCTLVYTGAGEAANVDYLNITGVRAFKL